MYMHVCVCMSGEPEHGPKGPARALGDRSCFKFGVPYLCDLILVLVPICE